MKPQAILRFDLEGNPARMTNIVEWLRETAAFLVEHSGEMGNKCKAQLFIEGAFHIRQAVSLPHKGDKIEGSVL